MAAANKSRASQPLADQPLTSQQLVNIHQAKTHLSQLLQEVEQGQEVVIARSGVPIARLVAWQAPAQPVAAPGAMRGQIQLADDFDAPLDGLFEALR
jgi:antitoxin (DNA-binding transcriptional repressor) of toxin-antitoxin stability system